MAQSVGFMGPVFSSAFVIPLVVGVVSVTGKGGGIASPISVLIAGIGVFAIGWIVSSYAKEVRTAGSLYEYVTRGLGERTGTAAGWLYYAGITMLTAALLLILGGYLQSRGLFRRQERYVKFTPVRRCGPIKRWPVRERIELPHLIHRTGHHVHHTTGFDREEIIDLCIRINSVQPGAGSPNWPPCLGLFKSVVATLTYMRHNRTQAEIGESLGVSQPTISRAISAITPLVPEATREFVPTADDLDPDAQYILDGTLLPCWSWDGHKELYSGKHKTTGMNVQVACTIYGKLAWISDPVNGSRHDNYCREESGVLLTMNPKNWIGDKGYIGNNMITPFRKPAGGELLDWQKEYNSEVNKIRWMIEQVISHFKNWTIMHTDYRRPLKTFETTISAVVGLHFYRTA